MRLWVGLFFFFFFFLFLFCVGNGFELEEPTVYSLDPTPIEEYTWKHDIDPAKQLEQIWKNRQPVIINDFPALKSQPTTTNHNQPQHFDGSQQKKPFRWNPTALAAEFDRMGSVKASLQPTSLPSPHLFMYHNEAKQWAPSHPPRHTYQRMFLADFWTLHSKKSALNREYYAYFTSGIESWPESVKNHIDLEYLHTVRPQEYWNSTVLPPKEERGNGEGKGEGGEECDVDYKYVSGETREEDFVMWMGGSNITAELHYDTFHNFYYQIWGKKVFYLSPPSQSSSLYLFPFPHPHNRQSLLSPFSSPPSSSPFSLFSNVSLSVATITKGQMLYLPPYHFHRVLAPSPSISFNMWVDSKETTLLEMVEGQPVPFDVISPKEITKHKLRSFIEHILSFLDINPKQFWKKIFELRWKFLTFPPSFSSFSPSSPSSYPSPSHCSVFGSTTDCSSFSSPSSFSPSPLLSPFSLFSPFGSCSYYFSFDEEGVKEKAERLACIFSHLLEEKSQEKGKEREREEGILFLMLCQYFENLFDLWMTKDETICFLNMLAT